MAKTYKDLKLSYQASHLDQQPNSTSLMQQLAEQGQHPEVMVLSCADSRVDPAIIFQAQPGDLFITRNVANILPAYKADDINSATGAAVEYAVCFLNVKHLIIMGHSECGGINAICNPLDSSTNDYIMRWVSNMPIDTSVCVDAKAANHAALLQSYTHALGYPWIKERIEDGRLQLHLCYFDIADSKLFEYDFKEKIFKSCTFKS